MKTMLNAGWQMCVVAALAALVMTGCQTSPYKKGASLSNCLQVASRDVQNESAAMKETMSALNTLVSQPSGDLRVPFKSYAKALSGLQKAAARTARTGESLNRKGQAHLAAWDQEMQAMSFEAVKNQSASRREAVAGSLQAVNQRYQEAGEAVGPLINYLQDIRRALQADLTIEGVTAVKSIAQNAQDNASRVDTALENLRKELDDLSRRLSPGQEVPAAAAPAAG